MSADQNSRRPALSISSLSLRPAPIHSAPILPPLCFQSLTTIKFSKPLVLTTMRIAGGCTYPLLLILEPSSYAGDSTRQQGRFSLLRFAVHASRGHLASLSSTFKRSDVPTILRSIPFLFCTLHTLLHNGLPTTLLESIRCALFSSRRRVYPLRIANSPKSGFARSRGGRRPRKKSPRWARGI